MYNNGITITAKDVNSLSINGNKKFLFTIKDMQVVNGGQTLRSIYQFKNEDFDEEKLADASILVRIFKTENNSDLTNDIAEYTNSQNSISASDLKSINNLQIKIENYLGQYKIDYVRKSGDVELKNAGFKRITKEKTAQILYSYNGFPDRATNQKSKLFEKYYDEIFDENNLDFELLYKLIDLYFKIEQKYDSLSYEVFPQKIFYIIYLYKYDQDITYTINIVENSLKEYRKNENISDARKLIQKGFKDKLDEIFNPK
jgi:AIPR protein.